MFLISAPRSLNPISYVTFCLEFCSNLTFLFPAPSLSHFLHDTNGDAKKGDSAEKEKIGERKMKLLKGLLWIADERQEGN